jgi:phosphoribosylanthranilate isomerase
LPSHFLPQGCSGKDLNRVFARQSLLGRDYSTKQRSRLQTMSTVRVKICGLTNLDDALVAVAAGADLLGFILYPQSPRYVAPAQIQEIVQEIRQRRQTSTGTDQTTLKMVGVFVNEPVERVRDLLAQTNLDYAQLHGDETVEMLAQLPGQAFKVLRLTSGEECLAAAMRFALLGMAAGPGLMIDAYDPHAYGGTGKTVDWHAAAAVAQRHPGLLLAGGLTPDNVAAAVRTVQPWGVDVSSGVEAAPGKKDHARVRAFVENARHATSEAPGNSKI